MDREKLKLEIMRDEGVILKPYIDTVGKVTIGAGRNLTDNGISPREAILFLENDMDACIAEAKSFVWFDKMDEIRQRVIVNMLFNLGLSRFLGFKKFINLLSLGKYKEASQEMLNSKWAEQVGDRAKRLSRMMELGV